MPALHLEGFGSQVQLWWILLAATALVLIFRLSRVGMRPKGYPPGPPTLPIIGNLHQFPRKDLHLQFQKWTEEYGPVVSLQLGTQTLILLGSATAVSDLLEKKGSIYSTRMDILFREYGNELNIAFRPYDDVLRRQRKVYHVRLNNKFANNYLPYQNFESIQLLYELLDSPQEYQHHLERFTISIGSTIAFGKRVTSADDPTVVTLLKWFRDTIAAGSSLQIGDWWPALRPVIRGVPSFMNPITKNLNELHQTESGLWQRLVRWTRNDMKSGRVRPSLCRDMISRADANAKDHLTEQEIWYTSGHTWAAATDTQSNTLLAFIKAMVLYPEVQALARQEVDTVVQANLGRLPEWDDRNDMPYIRRCLEETLRWAPPTITGGPMPHSVSKDDEYMGYKIPAGAGVMNCVWTVNNDTERFENPRDFNPLRYSEEDSLVEAFSIITDYDKRPHTTFGAGRRVCPGSHVAERTVFVGMARLLWAFEFRPKKDQNGNDIPIERDSMNPGVVVGPAPFECDIIPRSSERAEVIRMMYREANASIDTEGNYTEQFFRDNWKAEELM